LSNQKSVVCFPTPVRRSYLRAYKAPFYVSFCTFCASLRLTITVFTRPKTSLPHEIAQRYLFGLISASKNLCNLLLKICAICGKNLRNLRLIKDLRSTKVYVRNYKLFMQNEPKFRKVKLNVTKVLTKDYDQMDTWSIRKNEPKTNPNEPKPKQTQSLRLAERRQNNAFCLFLLDHPILRRFEAFTALPEIGNAVNFQAAKFLQPCEQLCNNFRVFRGKIRFFTRVTIKPVRPTASSSNRPAVWPYRVSNRAHYRP
jgi:hypothetical protein